MRLLVRTTVVVMFALLGAACTGEEATSTTGENTPALLTEPLQLAGSDSGSQVLRWDTVSDRAIVVYSVRICGEPQCTSSEYQLLAVDERGAPWVIADLEEDATFELDASGASVEVSSPGGDPPAFPIESPAPVLAGSAATGPEPGLDEIPGFVPHNDIAAVLADGRYLIRGQWDQDQPMEAWLVRLEGERTSAPRLPIRLFVYDPSDNEPAPVSGIPDSTEVSTAVSTSFGPDTVLRVELLAGDRAVAYTVGFNGAAYDIEHALYLAPLPDQ